MPFSQKTLSTLEYDKIIASLSECCATDGARAMAYSLMPSDDPDTVKRRQDRCDAARRLIANKGYPPFTAPEDVLSSCDRADKGAMLSTIELLHISALLHSARGVLDYHNSDRPFGTALDEHFARLQTARPLETAIDRAIKAEDMIADEASPALADIRRKIRQTNNKIKDILQSYTGSTRAGYLQDNVVTMRNGRYVVPVKAEYKNDVKGLVHDTSSSGATLFIEPMAVIEANNELRTLQSKEEREIERILSELSAAVSDQSGILRLDFHTITELAFYYAEGSLADKMKASRPTVCDSPLIDLKRARHPLIDPKKVVPIDVSLGEDYDTLIITGPNTGGKTVTLKTLGLFVMMAQAGLQIPAEEGSRIGVFSDVLADIGDEQSIEQSLSTFSSHMVNIVDILGKIGEGTLVLFDELGAGTDPIEGAALAVSILEEVRRSGSKIAATTHYAELKAYALDTEGVRNASCEFDVDTLRPTYKLIVGTPGKSNAFAISERLGLPEKVVSEAKTRVSNENRRFENVIERLESDRIAMERNREESERLRAEYEQFKRDAEQRLKQKYSESEKEIERERERARQMIDSARANSEFVFKQLEDIRKKQESGQFARELAEARAAVRDALKKSDDVYSSFSGDYSLDEEYVPPRPYKVGDAVYLVPYHQEGEITALPGPDGLFGVRAGILKAKMAGKDLRLLDGKIKDAVKKKKPPVTGSAGGTQKKGTSDFRVELDIRGRYGDDGWDETDKYLDQAVLSGISSVRIVHGKGTGALKKAIWERLKNDRRVKSYRLGNYGEGDSGVTVVELK